MIDYKWVYYLLILRSVKYIYKAHQFPRVMLEHLLEDELDDKGEVVIQFMILWILIVEWE